MNRLSAFLLAPVPAAIIGGFVSWVTGAHPRGVSIAIFYLLQPYALQLVLGLAIFALLRRSGRNSLLAFAFGGLIMVAVVAVPYLTWASSLPQNNASRTGVVLLIWLALGATTGGTAWLLLNRSAVRR